MKTCIHNGTIVLEDHIIHTDLLIENDRIAALGAHHQVDQTIDASDCYIFPGFIDIHTHLDDVIAGKYLADTWSSGSQHALQNGITTLGSFITQEPDESLTAAVERARIKASGKSHCDYLWHLTPVRFDKPGWEEIAACIEQGMRTFKFYTTYKNAGIYSSYDELEERISRLHQLGCTVLVHCEDDQLLTQTQGGNIDWRDPMSHVRLRPAAAEVTAILRLIDLARKTGAQIHIVHVSTPEGVEAIRSAPDTRVTCETCPHYLFLDAGYLARPDGYHWICAPPLRTAEQRQKLCELARHGAIDLFATDHCAFLKKDKDDWGGDIRRVPGGVAGIGALPHLVFKLYQDVLTEKTLVQISRQLCTNPARVTGLYPRKGAIQASADADLVVLQPRGAAKPVLSTLADAWETYPDLTSTLDIKYVFLRGVLAARDGRLCNTSNPTGACLCLT